MLVCNVFFVLQDGRAIFVAFPLSRVSWAFAEEREGGGEKEGNLNSFRPLLVFPPQSESDVNSLVLRGL